jgi:hypothetical protein
LTVSADITSVPSLPGSGSNITVAGTSYAIDNANQSWSLTNPNSHTLQFEIRNGDSSTLGTGHRTELADTNRIAAASTYHITYEMNLTSGSVNTCFGSGKWFVLGQIHDSVFSVNSPYEQNLGGDAGGALGSGDDFALDTGVSGANASAVYTNQYADSSPLSRSAWHQVDTAVTFNVANNATGNGSVVTYLDGVQVVNYSGPLGFFNHPTADTYYWKFGIYQGACSTTQQVQYRNMITSVTNPAAFSLSSLPFLPDSPWNTAITGTHTYTPVSWPASTGWNYSVSWAGTTGDPVYIASSSDPVATSTGGIGCVSGWGWPNNPSLKIPTSASPGTPLGSGQDQPLLILDADGQTMWNFWRFNWTGSGTFTCQAYAKANVYTDTGWGTSAVPGNLGAGSNAVGSSQFGGLLVQSETDAGSINHALAMAVDNSLLAPGTIPPAISNDGHTSGAPMKESMLMAIPKSTSMPGGLTALGQKVFHAMQDYGVYVIDNAGSGESTIRSQSNAYNTTVMGSGGQSGGGLRQDMFTLIPLLQIVN